jgi:predicted O-linked N-acetylglucosamine transferase (SPINDLY family)
LLVFARKPAPLQVSWLGYGYTTGLDAMDYFLADATFTPTGCEALFTEKLIRLPVFAAYRPADGMGEAGALPALDAKAITLGTLSRSTRLNHRVIRAWAGILHRLPDARLMINSLNMQDAGLQSQMREQFAAHGISAARLLLGCDSPPWDVLRKIDISLDCFPHNSGTTLFESLYLGVPYITLADRPSVGRLGAAILQALGHPEWIAVNEADYIDKTVALATDLDRLAALRAELRAQMQRSVLMDEPAFARSVETAYREMWLQWCQG